MSEFTATVSVFDNRVAVWIAGPLHHEEAQRIAARMAAALCSDGEVATPTGWSASHGHLFTIEAAA